ncbi:MAG: transglycosylase SLT domain-containing protein [Deltaproteobacteria bacterium]|nr:transglycosylase SLT domain-containing protein [Deltaproteobacteria bacterium]
MSGTRVIWIFFVGLGLLLWTGCPVSADVYRYVDKNGVWHFTNIKSDSRYRIYIRTARETPSEYIEKYGAMIKQASRRFGIEPSLIKAVIKAESDFDHRAVSHKGAQGLMQLMPNTAEAMDVDNPFNPEENIFGGNNNKRLALAAYNAGPEKVESYRGVPPYKETRTFVKKVFHYYRLYNTRAE